MHILSLFAHWLLRQTKFRASNKFSGGNRFERTAGRLFFRFNFWFHTNSFLFWPACWQWRVTVLNASFVQPSKAIHLLIKLRGEKCLAISIDSSQYGEGKTIRRPFESSPFSYIVPGLTWLILRKNQTIHEQLLLPEFYSSSLSLQMNKYGTFHFQNKRESNGQWL
jgi:hypothetical protein